MNDAVAKPEDAGTTVVGGGFPGEHRADHYVNEPTPGVGREIQGRGTYGETFGEKRDNSYGANTTGNVGGVGAGTGTGGVGGQDRAGDTTAGYATSGATGGMGGMPQGQDQGERDVGKHHHHQHQYDSKNGNTAAQLAGPTTHSTHGLHNPHNTREHEHGQHMSAVGTSHDHSSGPHKEKKKCTNAGERGAETMEGRYASRIR